MSQLKGGTPSQRVAAQVYREAARRIENRYDEYSCQAIRRALNENNELAVRYREVFCAGSETKLQINIYKAARELHDGERNEDWCRDFRVLMLCLMAAATERP